MALLGWARQARTGTAWQGMAGQGRLGRHGWARPGTAGQGRLGRHGWARPGMARRGMARPGRHGKSHKQPEIEMTERYEFRTGARVKASASMAGKELNRIMKSNGGKLKPRDVVHESKPKDAPLHNEFEWNNVKAADKYREDQARYIVSAVRIKYASENNDQELVVTRAFTSVETADEKHVFISTIKALSDSDFRHQIIYKAHKKLINARRELAEIGGLTDIIDSLDDAISKVDIVLKIEDKASISESHA